MAEIAATGLAGVEEHRVHSGLYQTVRAFKRDKAAVVSLLILAVVIAATLAAPLLPLAHPADDVDTGLRLHGVGTPDHILGLDGQGRDILSRLIWGGRASLPIALTPVVLSAVAGMLLGVTAGFLGGLYSNLVMRANDVLFAFPTVVLAITVAAFLGNGSESVIIASTVVLIPPVSRVAYAATREQLGRDFVLAARAIGASDARIMLRHIVPNMVAPVIVYVTALIGLMVVFTAGLSFLGLGIQPPRAEWGMMVAQGRDVLGVAPHVATIPGVVIAVVALCFNLVGDGLRYALDPHVRNL